MKTLIIVAIILGIAFLFFGGDKAIPAGITDLPKMLLDKVGEIKSGIFGSTGILDSGGEIGNIVTGPISTDNIVSGAKNFISNTIDKITETIKTPIEDKVKDIFCPQE